MNESRNKVNEYSISDLTIGQTEEFTVTITEKMQDMFKEITGDINPLHLDQDFARFKGYSDRLVYGMLTASFFSTLVGVYLPGKHCLFRECNVQWPNPVYPGDVLTVAGRIIEVNLDLKIVVIKAEIRNQVNKKVARAKLQVEVRRSDE